MRRALGQAFLEHRSDSPLVSALCNRLGSEPPWALDSLYDQYFRIISAFHPNVIGLVAGLHHLALRGDAAELAALFPTCGGRFEPDQDQSRLHDAVERTIEAHREDLLDFLLSHESRQPELGPALGLRLGAQVVVERFGGGLSLVQLGAENGLLLHFDRFRYQLERPEGEPRADQHLGEPQPGEPQLGEPQLGEPQLGEPQAVAPQEWVTLTSIVRDSIAPPPLGPTPTVIGRAGLGDALVDLQDQADRLLSEAFIAPDQPERLRRFRTACDLVSQEYQPRLAQGIPTIDLAPLLTTVYNEMAPGNTLLLFSVGGWSRLTSEEQKKVALDLQSLAAQVQPRKPIAWLQIETFPPRQEVVELRLHTFGWADLEDRAVRRLAEAAPDLSWIRWLEG